jgi:hypothetical protein
MNKDGKDKKKKGNNSRYRKNDIEKKRRARVNQGMKTQ